MQLNRLHTFKHGNLCSEDKSVIFFKFNKISFPPQVPRPSADTRDERL